MTYRRRKGYLIIGIGGIIMVKPRKQTYTMSMYLGNMKDKDIRNDADVQRLFVWSNEQVNELIYTVLTEDYIPPVILGEEMNSQKWIIDGGQRSSSLLKYRYGNYKITSTIEDSIVTYKAKLKDKNGDVVVDENGDILWEDVEFNIKNKTYDDLPEELKKRFNEYQIETVIHEDCNMKRISKLIKRYNNHTSMNTSQKAFTHIDNFAREIRGILDSKFFLDCGVYTENEKNKGVLERVVIESVMCMFHLDNWKKQTKQIATYLNKNADKTEFVQLSNNLHRLENIISEDVKDIFNSKNSFIWFSLYNKFIDLGIDDRKFVEFLREFKNGLRNKRVNGKLFDDVDKKRSTKDKAVIVAKLDILQNLMYEFLNVNEKRIEKIDVLGFLKDNVNPDISQEDIGFYNDILDGLICKVDKNSELLDGQNNPSLVAIVGYACNNDIDLDNWIVDFFKRNNTYMQNQKENYIHMKSDIHKYIDKNVKKSI